MKKEQKKERWIESIKCVCVKEGIARVHDESAGATERKREVERERERVARARERIAHVCECVSERERDG